MRRRIALLGVVITFAVVWGCEQDRTVAPEPSDQGELGVPPELLEVASALVERAEWPVDESAIEGVDGEAVQARHGAGCLLGFEREVLTGDIVHYTAQVRVGEGPYDVIGIHRVVQETRPYRPARLRESLFLVHGSSGLFDNGFLDPATSPDHASAVVLARGGVDVWGIDLGWSLVPREEEDLTVFAGWGIERDMVHLRAGLAIARVARLMTGNGWRKMDLLGHSYGAMLGWAYVDGETQIPRGHRHVKGFIPADIHFKVDFPELLETLCEKAAAELEELESGSLAGNRDLLWGLAAAARSAPDDMSAYFSWATNEQAAMFVGTSTFLFEPFTPFWHMVAGEFPEGGFPTVPEALLYTELEAFLVKLEGYAPYFPQQLSYELYAVPCDMVDFPFDDHLHDIQVPVFYVGAAGGFSEMGADVLSRIGSSDKSSLVVSLLPPDQAVFDFGHNDMFMSDRAVELVYQPILEWMMAR